MSDTNKQPLIPVWLPEDVVRRRARRDDVRVFPMDEMGEIHKACRAALSSEVVSVEGQFTRQSPPSILLDEMPKGVPSGRCRITIEKIEGTDE